MSTDVSAAASPSRRRRTSLGKRILWIVLAISMVGITGAYFTMLFGQVQGQEFSPDLFDRREFVYLEIPVIQLKISGIRRTSCTGNLEAYLVGEKIVTNSKKAGSARWDLVYAVRGAAPRESAAAIQGDALILCRYLDARDNEDNEIWLQWSKKYPALAKILWPVVADLAEQQLYIFIPDVFLAAREEQDADVLQKRIAELLLNKYLVFALSRQELNLHKEAIELFDCALKFGPGTPAVVEGRAKSLEALKNETPDTAETD